MHPPYERLDAHCFQIDAYRLLALGQAAVQLASLGKGVFTPVYVRYAYLHFETRRPFFPYLVADDWGNLFRDFEAIDWLISNGLMYPRSDVAGLWADGVQDQVFVKELDLAVPMTIFAAPSGDMSGFPGRPAVAAIEVVLGADFAVAPGGNLPVRLASALPVVQLNARLVGPQAFGLINTVLADPRPVRLDEVDRLLAGKR